MGLVGHPLVGGLILARPHTPRNRHAHDGAARGRSPAVAHAGAGHFLVTCSAGFEHVVAEALPSDVPRLNVAAVDSGTILVELDGSPSARRLAKLDYLSGVHQIIAEAPSGSHAPEQSFGRFVQALRTGRAPAPAALRGSFRLRVIREGQPVKIDNRARLNLERAVQDWSGMRPEARGGGTEVWIYARRDDPRVRLMLRLDHPERRRTAAGTLKPDVAAALVRVAPLGAHDVFLDAFAGSGAVSAARSRAAHSRIVVSDVDPARVADLRVRARRGELGPAAQVYCADVRDLVPAIVEPGSVDVAVLDPPWGSFDRTLSHMDLVRLYDATVRMLDQALAPGGHGVLLVLDADMLRPLDRADGLATVSSIPALVNGKKVRVVHVSRPS